MLLELTVENLLIVAQARLEPGEGLTVITGETGAGKSLLLDALDLLLGKRADSSLVGPAADQLCVSGVFLATPELRQWLVSALGLSSDSEDTIIIRRRVWREGRSQAWLNDSPVSVRILRQIGERLVEIRSQNEQLQLGHISHQLEMLDAFAGLGKARDAYAQAHQEVLRLQRALAEVTSGAKDSQRELEFIRYQLTEFDEIAPQPGEMSQVEERLGFLSSIQEWQALCAEVVSTLTDGEAAMVAPLARFARRLELAPDENLRQSGVGCRQAQELLADVSRECARVLDNLEADPQEIERLDTRLGLLTDLQRKHGGSEEHLFHAWEHLRQREEELAGLDEREQALRSALPAANEQRLQAGERLAQLRRKGAKKLAAAAASPLADLGMPRATLSLHETALAEPQAQGICHQELYIQTNPGLPAGPLSRVPSGGETSRLSLALSVALNEGSLTRESSACVLVYDEIDAGVGARMGAAIADQLLALGQGRSVIAISHTPQMAARAQQHYTVSKRQGDDSTLVEVNKLSPQQRLQEVAEMLGGGSAALNQARVLLGDTPHE
ncbi:MAG: hypothetical protein EA402_02260 [Planctomycetota bacterium]|nr:MAG: hypothetical protein EA402_02260 [Planctomycetota bacterium]